MLHGRFAADLCATMGAPLPESDPQKLIRQLFPPFSRGPLLLLLLLLVVVVVVVVL